MTKPRIATLSLSGCAGCHAALLDAHEGLLDVLGEVDLVHSFLTTGDELPECDVLLVEGAVGTARDAEELVAAREKAGTLVALGSCAAFGGIGALRNLQPRRSVVATAFGEGSSLGRTAGDGSIPELQPQVRPLSDLVTVDAEIPGCSPTTEQIVSAIRAAAAGEVPEGPRRTMCFECGRRHEKMLEHSRDFVSDAVSSVMELDEIDAETCFLEQGVICMGPMTRQGCGARCLHANIPCRGCMGPSRREFEQGGKMVDALAAVLPAGAMMFLDDLMGTGYRYTLPISVFPTIFDVKEADDA